MTPFVPHGLTSRRFAMMRPSAPCGMKRVAAFGTRNLCLNFSPCSSRKNRRHESGPGTIFLFNPITQMARPRYSIVVPAYNERARIGRTLENILEYLRARIWSAEIVVVDDGSRDETFSFVSQMAEENPELRIIQNPGNKGKGFAVRNGMLNARGEILLFTYADLSSPISEAPRLLAALEKGADVAIGSRWLDPSLQFQRQSFKRQALSRLSTTCFCVRCSGSLTETRNAASRLLPAGSADDLSAATHHALGL